MNNIDMESGVCKGPDQDAVKIRKALQNKVLRVSGFVLQCNTQTEGVAWDAGARGSVRWGTNSQHHRVGPGPDDGAAEADGAYSRMAATLEKLDTR